MPVQSCCFANQTSCFFDVLAAVAIVDAKAPYFSTKEVTGNSSAMLTSNGLNKGGLHLNREGKELLQKNFVNFLRSN